jgi:GTPase Era involved in 16S rRNA processing
LKVISELASALDLVKLRAGDVLDPDEIEDVEDIAERVEERRGFPGDVFVVALAGGTGVGKSSLLNALAGQEVASVSPVRPHTDQPLALLPEDPGFELMSFVDDMGIVNRVSSDAFKDLAVIDLPDQDSIAAEHRALVWDLLPEVDAIIWVVDPDKYRDEAFLRDYVRGLADYQDQALFVLNKIDLLNPDVLAEVEEDFVGQLELHGVVAPRVFAVAAAPPHQESIGTGELVDHLKQRLVAKRVLASKTVADISHAVSLMTKRARLERGGALGFDERWAAMKSVATEALDAHDVDAAIAAVDHFVSSLVAEVGPAFGRRLVTAVPPSLIERELTALYLSQPKRAVPHRRKNADIPEVEASPKPNLYASLAEPLRLLLWDRAYFGALLAAISVQAAQAQARFTT